MIINQSVFEKWEIEDKSVQAIITSPPYYSLRKYDIPDIIIGGDKDCQHEFEMKDMELGHENRQGKSSNSVCGTKESSIGLHGKKVGKQDLCIHCNAWKGQYGLEPDFRLYLEHTMLWLKEAWRVLKDGGILFLNIADTFSSSSGGYNKNKPFGGMSENTRLARKQEKNYPSKCKLLIPERLMIKMVDEQNWILRNNIVWFKPNAMPESCTDRFSKKWESIIFAVKQPKYYFNLDAVKEPQKEISIKRGKYLYGHTTEKQIEGREISGRPIGDKSHIQNKNPGDVWSIPTQPSSEKHYAMWAERLVERMIKCSTKPGDVVLDCFTGSGTTGIIAKRLHREFRGIDLGYHKMSKRRLTNIQKDLLL